MCSRMCPSLPCIFSRQPIRLLLRRAASLYPRCDRSPPEVEAGLLRTPVYRENMQRRLCPRCACLDFCFDFRAGADDRGVSRRGYLYRRFGRVQPRADHEGLRDSPCANLVTYSSSTWPILAVSYSARRACCRSSSDVSCGARHTLIRSPICARAKWTALFTARFFLSCASATHLPTRLWGALWSSSVEVW